MKIPVLPTDTMYCLLEAQHPGDAGADLTAAFHLGVFIVVHTYSKIDTRDTLEGLCQAGFEIYAGLFKIEDRAAFLFLAVLFFFAWALLFFFIVVFMAMSR